MVCSWLCAISFCHCSTVLPSSSWFLNTFISGSVILQRDAKIQTSIFLIVNFPVLHRLREALPKRRQVRKGAGLLQEGAARPPPEKLPILPPRQGATGFAKPAGGEWVSASVIHVSSIDRASRTKFFQTLFSVRCRIHGTFLATSIRLLRFGTYWKLM